MFQNADPAARDQSAGAAKNETVISQNAVKTSETPPSGQDLRMPETAFAAPGAPLLEKTKALAALLVFLIVFLLNFRVRSSIPPVPRMWLAMDALSLLVAAYLSLRHRRHITIRSCLSALSFAFLAGFAYQGYSVFMQVKCALCTYMAFMAAQAVFGTYRERRIPVLGERTWSWGGRSLLLGIGTGVVLGVVNFFLMSGNRPPAFHFSPRFIQVSLSPAVYEEIACRMLPYAFALHLLKGKLDTKTDISIAYVFMIVPHVLLHTPDYYLKSLANGVLSTVLLCLLFGLPFSLLQRKRDLGSAMVAHGVVDLVRFCFFGLPR